MNFQLMGMMGGLLCHFIDSPCMFKVSVAKRKLEMKFFFSVICISGISSFSDNAIYLYNQSHLIYGVFLILYIFQAYKFSDTSSTSKMKKFLAKSWNSSDFPCQVPQTVLSAPTTISDPNQPSQNCQSCSFLHLFYFFLTKIFLNLALFYAHYLI